MDNKQADPSQPPPAELAAILSGPGDPIWDDIFDWIVYLVRPFSSITANAIQLMQGAVEQSLNDFIRQSVVPTTTGLNMVGFRLDQLTAETYGNKALLKGLPQDVHDQVLTASMEAGADIIRQMYYNQSVYNNRLMESTYYLERAIRESAGMDVVEFRSVFAPYVTESRAIQESYLRAITLGNQDMAAHIAATHADLINSVDRAEVDIIGWIKDHVVDPIAGWWSSFLDRLFDFGGWIGGFLEAVWNWVSRDVPGHSPWYERVLGDVVKAVAQVVLGLFPVVVPFLLENLAPPIISALTPIGEMFNTVFGVFMDAIEGFISFLGPTNPDIAGSSAKSMGSLAMTALAGLAGMTLAGSWLKPLGGAGMGHVAAMIYEATNYKVITGASVTALAIAAIRTPMTYHFNNIFRPNLLAERDFMQLMSRKAFVTPEPLRNAELSAAVRALGGGAAGGYEARYIGYRGYPSEYLGLFKELANTPLRYFPLAGIARTGFYDFEWFEEALHRSGYSQTAIDALHTMYKKMVDENLQGTMSGAAVTRFKEGFTDEGQFRAEMVMLGYSEEQIDKYQVAAQMDYATDYLRDLIAAYRDSVRKGNLSLDEYRGQLTGLGIVPERVEAYVLREKVRWRPGEEPSALGLPKPLYETDAGKIEVDTIRRRRRKNLITGPAEHEALGALGMPLDLVNAIVANDDVRQAEKVEEG